jgi:hypothetical protein
MIRFHFLAIVLLAVVCASCGRVYLLTKRDVKKLTYKGNEVLIFRSDKNGIDSFFLLESYRDTLKMNLSALQLTPDHHEVITIEAATGNGKNFPLYRYEKSFRNVASVAVQLQHGEGGGKVESLPLHFWESYSKFKTTTVQIPVGVFEDVVKADTSSVFFHSFGKEPILTMWWSYSYGLIKFQKFDGTVWELIKRYQR